LARREPHGLLRAGLAQLVEHLICNQGVGGSNPSAGTTMKSMSYLEIQRPIKQRAVTPVSAAVSFDYILRAQLHLRC
jgi:hypothetical protein